MASTLEACASRLLSLSASSATLSAIRLIEEIRPSGRKGPCPGGHKVCVDDLGSLVAGWPVRTASVGVTGPERTLGMAGDPGIASVGKLIFGHFGWPGGFVWVDPEAGWRRSA
jgi:hypothetical protein